MMRIVLERAILVIIAVNDDYSEMVSWVNFFQYLNGQSLESVKLVVVNKLEEVGEVYPDAKYQHCTICFYRNVFFVARAPRKN